MKTITWCFSVILLFTMVSCEQDIGLKVAEFPDQDGPGETCGLYHIYWTAEMDSSILFMVDPSSGDAVLTPIDTLPIKGHIAMDSRGKLYLVDQTLNNPDVYAWYPGIDEFPEGSPIITAPDTIMGKFTQLVVADYSDAKYLVAGDNLYNKLYVVDITDESDIFVEDYFDYSAIAGESISGGDLAVHPNHPGELFLFTKEGVGNSVYSIKWSDKTVTEVVNFSNVDLGEVHGAAYWEGVMYTALGNESVLRGFVGNAGDNPVPVDYPLILNGESFELDFGDMASCSPEWPSAYMYHSQWEGTEGATTIFRVQPDMDDKTVKYTMVDGPFEENFHIGMDYLGYMYLVDEQTGNVYKWSPSGIEPDLYDGLVVDGATVFGNDDYHFTQLVVVQAGEEVLLLIGSQTKDEVYLVKPDESDPTMASIIMTYYSREWDVSGADLVVTKDNVGMAYMFTKAEDDPLLSEDKVWEINLITGDINSLGVNGNTAGEQINGSTFYKETIWLSKGTNKFQSWSIGSAPVTYTPDPEGYIPRLHYGDLASVSPVWDWEFPQLK